MKKNEIKDRMLLYINAIGKKKSSVAVEMGLSKSTFDSESEVGGKTIQRFHIMFPEVDLHWLLTGEGEMTLKVQNFSNEQPDQLSEYRKTMSIYEKAIEMLYDKYKTEK